MAVLAAQIMGHDAMFTLFGVYSFGIFFTVTIAFEGWEKGKGREGFLLTNNQAELLLIGRSLILKDNICPHSCQICQIMALEA